MPHKRHLEFKWWVRHSKNYLGAIGFNHAFNRQSLSKA